MRPLAPWPPVRLGPLVAGFAVAAAIAWLPPPAAAHAAPPPLEPETRLLHDHNDDCGGDGSTALCRGSHDLIALDVREAHDAEWDASVLVFRLFLDHEGGAARRDIVRLDAGGPRVLELTTPDGVNFTGTFDRVGPAVPLGDGARFTVQGTVRLATWGLAPGDVLSNFSVEAWRDGTRGDVMPGGYHGAGGYVADPPQGSNPTNTVRPSYAVAGPRMYVALSVQPGTLLLGSEGTAEGELTLTNSLRRHAQDIRLEVTAAHGTQALLLPPSGAPGTSVALGLSRGGSATVGLRADGPGTVVLEATTSRGGRTTLAVDVAEAPATLSPGGTKDSPGLPWALLALSALGAAWWRR